MKSDVTTELVCILNSRVLCQAPARKTWLIHVRGLQAALEHQESFDFPFPTSNTDTSIGMQLQRRNDNRGNSPVTEGMTGSASSAGKEEEPKWFRGFSQCFPAHHQPTLVFSVCCAAEMSPEMLWDERMAPIPPRILHSNALHRFCVCYVQDPLQ